MTETRFAGLLNTVLEQPTLADFWTQLKAGYDAFERKHRIPTSASTPPAAIGWRVGRGSGGMT